MITLSWHGGLDDGERAQVHVLAGAGEGPLSDDVLRRLGSAGAAHLLARDGADLVGFAQLVDGAAELVVHPDHRRAGLGTRLVAELLDRADGGQVQVWAHGEHPGAAALAARFGFERTRTLLQLRLDLPDLPTAPQLPPGVRLRPFVVGVDEAEFLRVNNAAFDWHPEQGGWGPEQVAQRVAESWFDAAGFLLAVDADDRLLGYHWTKVHSNPERIGEVYVVGVDPSARGLHLGSALTVAGLRHLHEQGLRQVLLYVESDNHAAVRVYRKLGFTQHHADVRYLRPAVRAVR